MASNQLPKPLDDLFTLAEGMADGCHTATPYLAEYTGAQGGADGLLLAALGQHARRKRPVERAGQRHHCGIKTTQNQKPASRPLPALLSSNGIG
jgi:hypothetical protein